MDIDYRQFDKRIIDKKARARLYALCNPRLCLRVYTNNDFWQKNIFKLFSNYLYHSHKNSLTEEQFNQELNLFLNNLHGACVTSSCDHTDPSQTVNDWRRKIKLCLLKIEGIDETLYNMIDSEFYTELKNKYYILTSVNCWLILDNFNAPYQFLTSNAVNNCL